MAISISHFEIKVRDLPGMEAFYTDTLGFRVTDRSPEDSSRGGHRMVFLSQNPGEHHQIVLNEANRSFSMKLKTAIFHRGHWII